ncbi:MAG: sigma-70 family RNA polymerase sigma factor [Flavobacteriales bacterium]|jgi:RNA polymerase sigma factor (sigma-70 family)|nr:sigma-70 family RNA polymerase sigma factor [Flavobacteriales bacterium]MBK6549007.1 sigma-70 family RNA polymerase sigma factor [Flavobacteriales bacterium]MBK6884400.1 sigma-70 family RNA polymerase sigma factor [Flavobacteriales bacterium]MBK7100797.1 sigma-70 family RNA polymerase sigma factor [Flavobacteriales bacterium]MBK7111484.1 sigma-70 family RNA polymerase sigma factor [Flavobacteriales bacterium]
MLSKTSSATKVGIRTDRELVIAYLEGNEKAFEQLLLRHKRKVWSHIYLLVRDRELTEDLFQETFIKVIHTLKSGKYNEEGKFLPWVMRIAHNLVIDHFRRVKKMPLVRSNDDHDVFATIAQPGKNVEQQIVNVQIDADVRKLIDSLPDEQRQVVMMRTYLGMSFKEISEHTEVSINTALGRMRYALINMRKMIKENAITLDRM